MPADLTRRTPGRLARPLVTALSVLVAACASDKLYPGLETTVLPPVIEYSCAEGRALKVLRAPESRSATAIVGTQSWTLPKVDGANQEKYAQGFSALYLDGEAAMLEAEGRVVVAQCRSVVALPKAPEMRPYKF